MLKTQSTADLKDAGLVKESEKRADPETDDERMQFLEGEHSDIFSIELMYSRKSKPEMLIYITPVF